MKKSPLFLLLLPWLGFSENLATWNNFSTPTPDVPDISTNAMILDGGITAENNGWSGFMVNNFHNGVNNTINYNKHLEFRVSANGGYIINMSKFKMNFLSPRQGSQKIQVRYSKSASFPANGNTFLISKPY